MSHISIDLLNLYNHFFDKSYSIPENWRLVNSDKRTIQNIPVSTTNAAGIEIFLPVTLWISNNLNMRIECCTIRVTGKKTIIKTALSERRGTVKRQFNTGDYIFNIKGVLIGERRRLPDRKIETLKNIYESDQPVYLHNAIAELFMPKCRVSIESIEFPEVEGKSVQHRPFIMVCETDYIQTLTLTD